MIIKLMVIGLIVIVNFIPLFFVSIMGKKYGLIGHVLLRDLVSMVDVIEVMEIVDYIIIYFQRQVIKEFHTPDIIGGIFYKQILINIILLFLIYIGLNFVFLEYQEVIRWLVAKRHLYLVI